MNLMNTTTNTETNTLQVANEIRRQLGGALAMLGAKGLVGGDDFLMFSIQGCPTVNKIKITLEQDDTYTISFYKLARRALTIAVVAEFDGVCADQLRSLIESTTGLRTRL
jgi:hypothetical protein